MSLLHPKINRRRPGGYALATILILLAVALFGSGVIITVSSLEAKISRSQKEGLSAYYVSEAGVRDVLWRLQNDSAYAQELMNGNLDRSYSVNLTDNMDTTTTCADAVPDLKQLFSVHVYTAPQGARYAIADVTGCSNNGSFTAKRRIQTTLFQNVSDPPTGGSVIFSGGDIQIKTGGTDVMVVGGSMYAKSTSNPSISITSQATVNLCYNVPTPCGNIFETPGTYNGGGGVVTGSYQDSTNTVPPPPNIDVPGFDFAYYSQPGNHEIYYTNTDFTNFIKNISNGGTATLNGVIYVNGNVDLGNIAKNKTLNVHGLLVISGGFSVASSATGFHLNIYDPGDNSPSGLAATSMMISEGYYNIQGICYSSGDMIFKNTDYLAVDGALISATSVQLNTSTDVLLTLNKSSVSRVFGGGQPGGVDVKHWEEEY